MRSNVADRYTRHAGRTAAWANSLGEELIGPKRILLPGAYVDGEEEVPGAYVDVRLLLWIAETVMKEKEKQTERRRGKVSESVRERNQRARRGRASSLMRRERPVPLASRIVVVYEALMRREGRNNTAHYRDATS